MPGARPLVASAAFDSVVCDELVLRAGRVFLLRRRAARVGAERFRGGMVKRILRRV
jgi:hypothetical protein